MATVSGGAVPNAPEARVLLEILVNTLTSRLDEVLVLSSQQARPSGPCPRENSSLNG